MLALEWRFLELCKRRMASTSRKKRKKKSIDSNLVFLFRVYSYKYLQKDAMALLGLSMQVMQCGSIVVYMMDSEFSGMGVSPGWGHCIVFFGKHNAILMGTTKLQAQLEFYQRFQ